MFYVGIVSMGEEVPQQAHAKAFLPPRDQPHDSIVQNRVYSGNERGVKRVVKAEKGREREK